MSREQTKGFTLVEMLVAVSLFTIVAFIVTTAFITMIDAYRRSQNIRLVVENLNFAMDSITIRLREGTEYQCLNSDGEPVNCAVTGSPGISFHPADAQDEATKIEYWFKKEGPLGALVQDGSPITAPIVNVTDVRFIVDKTNQPRVTIFLKGEAGPEKNKTSLAIQTTVSQRNIDEIFKSSNQVGP